MSQPTFATLSAQDCLLLPEDLVQRYNTLVDLLRQIHDNVPRLSKLIQELTKDVIAVRKRLERKRFPVGFLGATQIGKSKTFNNILEVANQPDRRPSQHGNGESTTSVITRLRSQKSGPEQIKLFYLNEEEYRFKRDSVCRSVQIDPTLSDERILELLPEQEQRIQEGKLIAMSEDPRYLKRLLNSHLNNPDKIGAEPEMGNYDDRFTYLNHTTVDSSPYLLLNEALISFPTEIIHPDLELIDLPGLGAHVSVDSITSQERLRELDGALVFLQVTRRTDAVAEQVFARLREAYRGDFVGRVWIVLTYCDKLGPDFLTGSQGSNENGFDGIARLASRHTIPLDQVYLVSNYVASDVPREKDGSIDPDKAAVAIGFPAGEVPTGLHRHQGLIPNYKTLFKDGGIGHLQKLLKTDLLPIVRKRTQDWIVDRLGEICKRLRDPLEFARTRGREDILPDVNKCLNTIHDQLTALTGRTRMFDTDTKSVREELNKHLNQRFAPSPYNDSRTYPEIRNRFRADAQALQLTLISQFSEVARKMFTGVGANFSGLPTLPVLAHSGVAAAWKAFTEQDTRQPEISWASSRFPTFDDDSLFEDIDENETDGLNGVWYRKTLQEKMTACTFSAMHLLRWRLVERLQEIERALNDLTRISPEDGTVGKVNYDELLKTLRIVCPST